MPPRYLHLDLPKHVVRNVSRFRLRAHTLAVKSSIWRGWNGHCNKCSCAAVQNEVHVLFHCQDLFVCSLRRKNSSLLFSPCRARLQTSCLCLSFPMAQPLWTNFWLAKTSNKPISLTTWLAVDPYLVILYLRWLFTNDSIWRDSGPHPQHHSNFNASPAGLGCPGLIQLNPSFQLFQLTW